MLFKAKIDKKQVYKWGVGAGLAQLLYILFVVLLMMTMDGFFSESAGGPLAMVAVLILLVFSAAISGLIVFGYPAYLFLQKKYQQAICTLVKTLMTIALGFILVLIIVIIK